MCGQPVDQWQDAARVVPASDDAGREPCKVRGHGEGRVALQRGIHQAQRTRGVAAVEGTQAFLVESVRDGRAGPHCCHCVRRRVQPQIVRDGRCGAVDQCVRIGSVHGVSLQHGARWQRHSPQGQYQAARCCSQLTFDDFVGAGAARCIVRCAACCVCCTRQQFNQPGIRHHLQPAHARQIGGQHVPQHRTESARVSRLNQSNSEKARRSSRRAVSDDAPGQHSGEQKCQHSQRQH